MSREFKSIAKKYNNVRGLKSENIEIWINAIAENGNLQPGHKIIDLGCGTGKFIIPFSKRGYDVYGIDISEDMLNVARGKDKENLIKWYKSDITDLPFENNYFNVCFQSMVIMHVKDKTKLFKEIYRVLNGNGTCFIRMLSHEQIKSLDWFRFFPELLKEDLKLCPDKDEVKEYMEEAGFTKINAIKIVEKRQTSPIRRFEQAKQKAFSGLRILSNEEYQTGLRKYKEYIENLRSPNRPEDSELLLVMGVKDIK